MPNSNLVPAMGMLVVLGPPAAATLTVQSVTPSPTAPQLIGKTIKLDGYGYRHERGPADISIQRRATKPEHADGEGLQCMHLQFRDVEIYSVRT